MHVPCHRCGQARAFSVHLIAAAEDVHLVDEEDDLLAPLPDVLQEAYLAVRKRAVCSTERLPGTIIHCVMSKANLLASMCVLSRTVEGPKEESTVGTGESRT